VVVPTGGDRTIFFDFLPIYAGELRGMQLRVQLYTVPGQVHYNATRQVVLRGVDGVVFVADSQREMMGANRDSFENLKENLLLQGLTLAETPHVLQYNKRDLRNPVSIEELDQFLNEFNAPFFEAVATQGVGVEETLQGIIKLVARSLRDRFKVAVPAGEARQPVAVIPSAPATPPPMAVAPGLRPATGGFDGPTIVSPPRPVAEPPRTPARIETSPFPVPLAPAPAPAAAVAAPAAASARPAPPWANRELTQPLAVEEIEYEPPTSTVRPPVAPAVEPSPYLHTPPPPPAMTVTGSTIAPPPVTSTPFTAAPVSAAPVAAARPAPAFAPPAPVTAPTPPARSVAPAVQPTAAPAAAAVPAVRSAAPFVAPPAASVPLPEDPFDVTMPLPSRSIPVPRRIDDVFALAPAPPVQPEPVVREQAAQAAALAVQRVVPRAIAQYGEVRELELEVPVPSAWVGGTRMTLQLRLTLVPQEEKDSG
jgi:signal recognition particle receptor subunit beta